LQTLVIAKWHVPGPPSTIAFNAIFHSGWRIGVEVG
jgi:hypothetical protein